MFVDWAVVRESLGVPLVAATALSIKRWSAWMPGVHSYDEWKDWALSNGDAIGDENASPDVQAIPPMLRRRLSPLGKMALSVALPLVDSSQSLPSVFCSRHGELERTVGMLKCLAENEPLSPTHFSLSVHNAIGGVFSIARKDPSAITALAIGDEGFSQALVEASLILEEGGHQEILCVIYDAPVPQIYNDASLVEVSPSKPYAAAFVLGLCGDDVGQQFSVQLVAKKNKGVELEKDKILGVPDALKFIRLLIEDEYQDMTLVSKRHGWHWKKI